MNDQLRPVVPRRVATGVCLVEATAVGVFAVLLARAAVLGDAVDVVAASVQASVASVVAVALAALGLTLLRGSRWPTGLIIITQLLVAVIALSQLGTALRGGRDSSFMLLALFAALAVAAAGLWSCARLSMAHHRTPPGPAAPGRD